MNQRLDTLLILSWLGCCILVALIIVSAVCLVGLECRVIHWGPADIQITGDGRTFVPRLPDPQHELRVYLFGKEMGSFDATVYRGYEIWIPVVCHCTFIMSLLALLVLTRVYRRTNRRHFTL